MQFSVNKIEFIRHLYSETKVAAGKPHRYFKALRASSAVGLFCFVAIAGLAVDLAGTLPESDLQH